MTTDQEFLDCLVNKMRPRKPKRLIVSEDSGSATVAVDSEESGKFTPKKFIDNLGPLGKTELLRLSRIMCDSNFFNVSKYRKVTSAILKLLPDEATKWMNGVVDEKLLATLPFPELIPLPLQYVFNRLPEIRAQRYDMLTDDQKRLHPFICKHIQEIDAYYQHQLKKANSFIKSGDEGCRLEGNWDDSVTDDDREWVSKHLAATIDHVSRRDSVLKDGSILKYTPEDRYDYTVYDDSLYCIIWEKKTHIKYDGKAVIEDKGCVVFKDGKVIFQGNVYSKKVSPHFLRSGVWDGRKVTGFALCYASLPIVDRKKDGKDAAFKYAKTEKSGRSNMPWSYAVMCAPDFTLIRGEVEPDTTDSKNGKINDYPRIIHTQL